MVERFIMAGDTALHICDSQKGEKCVVLLHGYLENMLVWEHFASLLYKRVRVITLDLPGHGISEVKGDIHTMDYLADTIVAMLDVLAVERAVVVGHSMGGYVALAAAERHPERLSGLVLLSSTPNADSDEKRENRRREIALVQSGKKDALARFAPSMGFAAENRKKFADAIDDLTEIVHLTEDSGIVALLGGMIERRDQNAMLQESKIPQLFILGRCDEYITSEIAEAMVARHPQADVVWLDKSGHMGYMEQAEECAEALLSWVEALK